MIEGVARAAQALAPRVAPVTDGGPLRYDDG